MTISDKIRIYELSRDLNLENKDILDAAQKLSISVKSHSSSISAEDAKKIKNLISKKDSDKTILSINKPSIKNNNHKQTKEEKSTIFSSTKEKPLKDNSIKKPLLVKPLSNPKSLKTTLNQPKNPDQPALINNSQSRENSTNQNISRKPSQNLNPAKKTYLNNTTPPIKSPAKPPIQLIAKPKNLNNVKSNESSKKNYNLGDKRKLSNKPDQNINNPKTNNINNRKNAPELVGAPIRRNDQNIHPKKPTNKQNISFKQTFPNRPSTSNKTGFRNKPSDKNKSGSFNREGNPNRSSAPNRPGIPNRPGSKFNSQNPNGIRKPVSPNELLQLQKTNKAEKGKLDINDKEKEKIEFTKQKPKSPNVRPNAAPSSKKPAHRAFSNSSKKNRKNRLGR